MFKKRLFIGGITALILIGVLILRLYYNPTFAQFNLILKESGRHVLDLRKIDSVNWDELVIFEPYTDICDYGISGYEKNGANCWASSADSECYLLFLRENRIVSKIEINLKEIDFAKSGLKIRIPKQSAVFQFASTGDWPIVKILPVQ